MLFRSASDAPVPHCPRPISPVDRTRRPDRPGRPIRNAVLPAGPAPTPIQQGVHHLGRPCLLLNFFPVSNLYWPCVVVLIFLLCAMNLCWLDRFSRCLLIDLVDASCCLLAYHMNLLDCKFNSYSSCLVLLCYNPSMQQLRSALPIANLASRKA